MVAGHGSRAVRAGESPCGGVDPSTPDASAGCYDGLSARRGRRGALAAPKPARGPRRRHAAARPEPPEPTITARR